MRTKANPASGQGNSEGMGREKGKTCLRTGAAGTEAICFVIFRRFLQSYTYVRNVTCV